jgi:hypothetical protein
LGLCLAAALATACDDDIQLDYSPSHPQLEASTPAAANFGDSIPFTVTVSGDVPLSTLTARLFYGEEAMDSLTLRTKEAGSYSGKLFAPFLKDVPDGNATLTFTLVDTHLSKATKESNISLTRRQYPYLILVTAYQSYAMLPTGTANEYAATEYFPSTDLPAYIKTPVLTDNANEVTFGWENGAVTQGVTESIPFASPVGGKYSVTFNTLTYAASPFFEILLNSAQMSMVDKTHYQIDVDLTQNQAISVEGINDLTDWWIDPDFLAQTSVGNYTFVPTSGRYRIIADLTLKYFRVYALGDDGQPAIFHTADGSGAIWAIGENIGKPSLASNTVGWTTEKGLCMAPMGGGIYRISFVAGTQITADVINFKFYFQMGWGDSKDGTVPVEFDTFSSINGGLVLVGDGTGKHDKGNLYLADGVTLEAGATYIFTIDASGGGATATLSVVKK